MTPGYCTIPTFVNGTYIGPSVLRGTGHDLRVWARTADGNWVGYMAKMETLKGRTRATLNDPTLVVDAGGIRVVVARSLPGWKRPVSDRHMKVSRRRPRLGRRRVA